MTNKEYYREQILEIACNGSAIAVDDKGNPKCCDELCCRDCLFSKGECTMCPTLRKKWLNKEYVEPCPFEKDELVEVSDDGIYWALRYFSHINDDATFACRATNRKTASTIRWKYCRKYGTLGGLVKGVEK